MKKIYLIICIMGCTFSSFAQTFPNAGMETWRNSTAGSSSTPVHAPTQWYGFDSLIIADGETFPYSLFFSGALSAQLFQETSIIHGGSSSAKLITLRQDTLGFVPGILSNALPSVNLSEIATLLTSGGSPTGAITYSGGTAVSSRIKSVSAWVRYDTGSGGTDTAVLVVQAISTIGGVDSVVGTGTYSIGYTGSSWVQITDSIVYTDTVDAVDTIRVNFASSGGGGAAPVDSSTLYVDDVTMYSATSGVKSLLLNSDAVQVYPNPAQTILHIDCPQNTALTCELYSISGAVVITKQLTGKNELDISELASGMYFYVVSDNSGNIIQRGKVAVTK